MEAHSPSKHHCFILLTTHRLFLECPWLLALRQGGYLLSCLPQKWTQEYFLALSYIQRSFVQPIFWIMCSSINKSSFPNLSSQLVYWCKKTLVILTEFFSIFSNGFIFSSCFSPSLMSLTSAAWSTAATSWPAQSRMERQLPTICRLRLYTYWYGFAFSAIAGPFWLMLSFCLAMTQILFFRTAHILIVLLCT